MADIITVAALNAYVRSVLESDEVLAGMAIRGEVSNFNRHFKTGHCYFTLKDEKASVKAVLFRSDAEHLSFLPENGMRIIVRGRISLYERDGAYQIYVDAVFPDGVGAAQMAFEQLKTRLAQEGLFAPEHKKPLPVFPAVVGLVTSKTGAALQDILKVAAKRCPTAKFLLAPVSVQGEAAAPEIAAAVRMLDEGGKADVIIVARGGGSAEDLWVFNSEEIARAVFACRTPVVSSIGHEIDFTILDFVADLRAPTPSAAAEAVLPDLQEKLQAMLHIYTNVANIIHHRLDSWYNTISAQRRAATQAGPRRILLQQWHTLSLTAALCTAAIRQNLERAAARFSASVALADGLNPYTVLARGYSMACREGKLMRSVQALGPGDELEVRFFDGIAGCTVNKVQRKKVNVPRKQV